VTATDPTPRTLPEIGQTRYADDVRIGWHVLTDDGWRLVLAAHPPVGAGSVLLVVREGMHEERDLRLTRLTRMMTRTPQEQIAHIEAQRVDAPPRRGMGPVSRLHFDQQVTAALADMAKKEDR
jgi:hypothetical protein